jgi:hypothetical protein
MVIEMYDHIIGLLAVDHCLLSMHRIMIVFEIFADGLGLGDCGTRIWGFSTVKTGILCCSFAFFYYCL